MSCYRRSVIDRGAATNCDLEVNGIRRQARKIRKSVQVSPLTPQRRYGATWIEPSMLEWPEPQKPLLHSKGKVPIWPAVGFTVTTNGVAGGLLKRSRALSPSAEIPLNPWAE